MLTFRKMSFGSEINATCLQPANLKNSLIASTTSELLKVSETLIPVLSVFLPPIVFNGE